MSRAQDNAYKKAMRSLEMNHKPLLRYAAAGADVICVGHMVPGFPASDGTMSYDRVRFTILADSVKIAPKKNDQMFHGGKRYTITSVQAAQGWNGEVLIYRGEASGGVEMDP